MIDVLHGGHCVDASVSMLVNLDTHEPKGLSPLIHVMFSWISFFRSILLSEKVLWFVLWRTYCECQALMPFCFCSMEKLTFQNIFWELHFQNQVYAFNRNLSPPWSSPPHVPRHVQNSSHYWPWRSRVKSWNITGQRGTGVHLIPVCWNVARWTDTMWFR